MMGQKEGQLRFRAQHVRSEGDAGGWHVGKKGRKSEMSWRIRNAKQRTWDFILSRGVTWSGPYFGDEGREHFDGEGSRPELRDASQEGSRAGPGC